MKIGANQRKRIILVREGWPITAPRRKIDAASEAAHHVALQLRGEFLSSGISSHMLVHTSVREGACAVGRVYAKTLGARHVMVSSLPTARREMPDDFTAHVQQVRAHITMHLQTCDTFVVCIDHQMIAMLVTDFSRTMSGDCMRMPEVLDPGEACVVEMDGSFKLELYRHRSVAETAAVECAMA